MGRIPTARRRDGWLTASRRTRSGRPRPGGTVASRARGRECGEPAVVDVVRVGEGNRAAELRLRRDARAFFQGNRYLLEPFVQLVTARVPVGPVVDLYAGVGLFGLALAAMGAEQVTLVEGDPVSSGDLKTNAEPFGDRARVERRSVEAFLTGKPAASAATVIVDPPRTGLSKEALACLIAARPPR